MSRYGVKEVFLTLQGEGLRAGAKSVFVRFTGCNLWDGHPLHRDRGEGPCARWCDTDFFKGKAVGTEELLELMGEAWHQRGDGGQKWCVLTGGEPALQLDLDLVKLLHSEGWRVAVETNGTVESKAVRACDHVCLSPKRGTDWHKLGFAHEVKVVLPGAPNGDYGWTDEELEEVERTAKGYGAALFVQPQDPLLGEEVGETLITLTHKHGSGVRTLAGQPDDVTKLALMKVAFDAHVERCVEFVMEHPGWRLSLQSHKFVDLS